MNKAGQLQIIGVMIAVLVGLVLLGGAIFPLIGESTLTVNVVNDTQTLAAAGSAINLLGREVSSVTVQNSTEGEVVNTANYTIGNNQIVNDELTAIITTDAGANYASAAVNLSYTYEPTGYPDDAGTRSVIALVAIVSALAVLALAIPNVRNLFT